MTTLPFACFGVIACSRSAWQLWWEKKIQSQRPHPLKTEAVKKRLGQAVFVAREILSIQPVLLLALFSFSWPLRFLNLARGRRG
jgi:uncharacterized iron-regulated membrane protein